MGKIEQTLSFKDTYELGAKPFKGEVEPSERLKDITLLAIESVNEKVQSLVPGSKFEFPLERIHFLQDRSSGLNELTSYLPDYYAITIPVDAKGINMFKKLVHEMVHAASSNSEKNYIGNNDIKFKNGITISLDTHSKNINIQENIPIQGMDSREITISSYPWTLNTGLNEALTEEIAAEISLSKLKDLRKLNFFDGQDNQYYDSGTIFYKFFDPNNGSNSYALERQVLNKISQDIANSKNVNIQDIRNQFFTSYLKNNLIGFRDIDEYYGKGSLRILSLMSSGIRSLGSSFKKYFEIKDPAKRKVYGSRIITKDFLDSDSDWNIPLEESSVNKFVNKFDREKRRGRK